MKSNCCQYLLFLAISFVSFQSMAIEIMNEVPIDEETIAQLSERTVAVVTRKTGELENEDLVSRCLGTLLKQQWVLTAAHCFKTKPDYVWIIRDTKSEPKAIERVYFYPKLPWGEGINDIALLKVSEGDEPELTDIVSVESHTTSPHFSIGSQSDLSQTLQGEVRKRVGTIDGLFQAFSKDFYTIPDHRLMTLKTIFVENHPQSSTSNFILHPGDSGGGLYNRLGQLVGVSTAQYGVIKKEHLNQNRTYIAEMTEWAPISSEVYEWIQKTTISAGPSLSSPKALDQ